ncbi:hypothetical protein TcG_10568 [Trypanosoma cruzi]|nr:hypothetical protein TcG_10568 [Trypanosoma cruzi]
MLPGIIQVPCGYVDADVHPSLPMTVYGYSALTAQKGCVPHNNVDPTRAVGTQTYSTNRVYVKVTAKHPPAITPQTPSHAVAPASQTTLGCRASKPLMWVLSKYLVAR